VGPATSAMPTAAVLTSPSSAVVTANDGNGAIGRSFRRERYAASTCSRQMWPRSEPWLLEVFGLALVLAHSPSLVEAFGGPSPISLAEFRAGG
jgi:hypothetical protein